MKCRVLRLARTILLPNDDGIYKIEIRDGLPVFVDVKVYERVGDEELFRK
ncbi:MAG: hypothetical protein RDU59_01770 [Thermodesulfobacteriota bacterium]|nr:hypothetical protein [Thermodesulfobacteriota bacterium]